MFALIQSFPTGLKPPAHTRDFLGLVYAGVFLSIQWLLFSPHAPTTRPRARQVLSALHDALEAHPDLRLHGPSICAGRQAIDHGVANRRRRGRIGNMMQAYVRTTELEHPGRHAVIGCAVETVRLLCDQIEAPHPLLMSNARPGTGRIF